MKLFKELIRMKAGIGLEIPKLYIDDRWSLFLALLLRLHLLVEELRIELWLLENSKDLLKGFWSAVISRSEKETVMDVLRESEVKILSN